MLPLEHSAILLTCNKPVLKTIFGLFESGRFTQVLLYAISANYSEIDYRINITLWHIVKSGLDTVNNTMCSVSILVQVMIFLNNGNSNILIVCVC